MADRRSGYFRTWARTELTNTETWAYSNVVQDAILKHYKNNHGYKTISISEIGKKLKKLLNVERRQKREGNYKPYFYVFPPLQEARSAFISSQNLSESQWEDITEGKKE